MIENNIVYVFSMELSVVLGGVGKVRVADGLKCR